MLQGHNCPVLPNAVEYSSKLRTKHITDFFPKQISLELWGKWGSVSCPLGIEMRKDTAPFLNASQSTRAKQNRLNDHF